MYVFLWLRRLWTWGQVMFGFFVLAILLGSMVTGWHYLIDGLAGIPARRDNIAIVRFRAG